ncbi:hypothetical protein [Streptomyces sp. NPDC060194]|uniref:hypothetical protein n=1 Tax=Streptomyces sp. NPDC060194 TaxID=3347069 RepID=UPI00365CCDF2
MQQAYARLAGTPTGPGLPSAWRQSPVVIGDRTLSRVRLQPDNGRPAIQLVFLRLPDGVPTGTGTDEYGLQSLLRLYQGRIRTINASDRTQSYTERQLLDTLTALIRRFRASDVRTLDYLNSKLGYSITEGVDHSDHSVAARLLREATLRARQQSRAALPLQGYEGYGIATRPGNLPAATSDRKRTVFRNYDVHDDQTGDDCPTVLIYCTPDKPRADDYASWVRRFYPCPEPRARGGQIVSWIGNDNAAYTRPELCLTASPATSTAITTASCGRSPQQWSLTGGALRQGTRCARVSGDRPVLGACPARPTRWTLTPAGRIRTGTLCRTQDDLLRTRPRLRTAPCSATDPGQRWFTDRALRTAPSSDALNGDVGIAGSAVLPLGTLLGSAYAAAFTDWYSKAITVSSPDSRAREDGYLRGRAPATAWDL